MLVVDPNKRIDWDSLLKIDVFADIIENKDGTIS